MGASLRGYLCMHDFAVVLHKKYIRQEFCALLQQASALRCGSNVGAPARLIRQAAADGSAVAITPAAAMPYGDDIRAGRARSAAGARLDAISTHTHTHTHVSPGSEEG